MNISFLRFTIYMSIFGIIYTCQRGCLICQQTQGGLCLYCDTNQGFVLENGFCIDTQQTQCMQFSASSQCIQCVPFHQLTTLYINKQVKKVCQYQLETNCMVFDYAGKCVKCSHDYFLQDGNCVKVDKQSIIKGCSYYKNQYECDGCKLHYILKDGDCIRIEDNYKIQDCVEYTQQKCTKCYNGYQYDDNSYYLTIFDKLFGNNQIIDNFQYDYSNQIYYSKEQCFKQNIDNCQIYKNNLNCQKCDTGFYLNQNKCHENPKEPMTDCDIHQDTSLNKCIYCSIQSYLNTSQVCIKLSDEDIVMGCLRYKEIENTVICTVCDKEYYLQQGKCIKRDQTVQNCEIYDLYKDSCKQCQTHYIPNIIEDRIYCIEKLQNCKQAQNDKCVYCDDQYYIQNDFCIQGYIQNCLYYQNGICTQCQDEFQLLNNTCQEITQKNCISLEQKNDSYICKQCKKGFQNIQIMSHCQMNDENCISYDEQNQKCNICKENYYILNNKCVQKFCKDFDEDMNCVKCYDYYQLQGKQCVQKEYQLKNQNQLVILQQNVCQLNQIFYQGSINICLSKEYEIEKCLQYQRIDGQVVCNICKDGFYLSNDYKKCVNQCEEGQVQKTQYINQQKRLQCIDKTDIKINNCQKINQIDNKIICTQCMVGYGFIQKCNGTDQECSLINNPKDNCKVYDYDDSNELQCVQCQFGYKFVLDQISQLYICMEDEQCVVENQYIVDQATNELSREIFDKDIQEVLSCHQLQSSQNDIQIIQQKVNLDTGLSKTEKQTLIEKDTSYLFSNCAFGVRFEFGQEIDYKCLACKPGYKPVYGILFVESCEMIENCDFEQSQQYLNKCKKCVKNFILQQDEQSCMQNNDMNVYNLKQKIPNCLDSDYLQILKQDNNYQINYNYQSCNICGSDQIQIQIKGNHCISLVENFDYFDLKNSISQNCQDFNQYYECIQCEFQYALITESKQCVQNTNLQFCKSAKNENECTQCIQNYYLQNGKCVKSKVDNCQQIDDSNDNCDKCIDGYYLIQNKCIKGQILNCQTYQQNQYNNCQLCEEGYQMIMDQRQRGIQCTQISHLQDCKQSSYNFTQNVSNIGCSLCKNEQGIVHENIYLGCQELLLYKNCEEFDIDQNICKKCSQQTYNEDGFCKRRLHMSQLCIEYYKDKDSCKICTNDFLWDDNIEQCVRIQYGIAGCLEYNSLHNCKICKKDYYRNELNKCSRVNNIIDGCQIYFDKNTCQKCEEFYQLEKNKCIKGSISNCLSWTKNQQGKETCLKCQNEQFFKQLETQIVCQKNQIIQNCHKYNQNQLEIYCEQCQEGYYYDYHENQCIKDDIEHKLIEHCKIYIYFFQQSHKCFQCNQNYHLNTTQDKCIQTVDQNIQQDCQVQQQILNPVCKRCRQGYYLNQNECLQCNDIEHCAYCNPLNPSQCLMCRSGFQINEDGYCLSFMGQVEKVRFIETNIKYQKMISIFCLLLVVFI